MRRPPLPHSRAGRALLAFWAVILLGGGGLAGALQWLGPPRMPAAAVHAGPRPIDTAGKPAAVHAAAKPAPAPPQSVAAAHPGRLDIVPPDPGLLEPAPHDPGAFLPRISADGRLARLLYAAQSPHVPEDSKRVAILISGVGLSAADSIDAAEALPSAVSFAVSPYSEDAARVLDAARRTGHELLLSLPMEPAGAPIDDEGAKALTEQVGADENARRLEWSLSRIQGYAGVTNAAGGLGGESFAGSLQFPPILHGLARRGLFYLNATPDGAIPGGIEGARADLRLDDPASAANIKRQLAELQQIAIRRGSAIGVAGPLFPVTIQQLADWIHALPALGLVLVPVSSLMRPPQPVLAGSVQ